MKKIKDIVLLFLLILALAGVIVLLFIIPRPTSDPVVQLPKDNIREVLIDASWRVVEIEGCEYFYREGKMVLCHKGNCKNPIHKYNWVEK